MTIGNIQSPFVSCSNEELKCINHTDRYFQNSEHLQISDESKNNYRLTNFTNDISGNVNLSKFTDCSYFTVEDFQNTNLSPNFNIFHCNINGLATKLDQL